MSLRYLFNSEGEYVAFVHNNNVFSPVSEWLGSVQRGNVIYSPSGEYVGHISEDDRVLRNKVEHHANLPWLPPRPITPLSPMRPIRRLRKPTPNFPLVDVFASGPVLAAAAKNTYETIRPYEGGDIFASDDKFLGRISKNVFDQYSLANRFQSHGNEFHPDSIFNQFGQYGSRYSQLSPFNEFSTTPPRIVKNNTVVAFLTTNRFKLPRLDPHLLVAWLERG